MKTILVIEDNDEVLENICEILELSGYHTHAAKDGSEGIQIALRERPDLILCDVMMPKLDGFGVLKILRNNKITSDTPLIFLTARVDKEDFRKGMGLGADDYITKPFDDTELLSAVEIRLNRHIKHLEAFSTTNHNSKVDLNPEEWFKSEMEEGVTKLVEPGEVLFRQEEQARNIYYLQSGLLKQVMTSSMGKELICGYHSTGDIIGTEALSLNPEYLSTVLAATESVVLPIALKKAKELIADNRMATHYILKRTFNDNKTLQIRLLEMAYDDVRKKVANAVLTMAKLTKEHPGYHPSREELATLAGVAKETLIRTLSSFKSEKLIAIDKRIIQILDYNGLAEIQ